jgi:hypothetical protein
MISLWKLLTFWLHRLQRSFQILCRESENNSGVYKGYLALVFIYTNCKYTMCKYRAVATTETNYTALYVKKEDVTL